jgi:hypothetical protein
MKTAELVYRSWKWKPLYIWVNRYSYKAAGMAKTGIANQYELDGPGIQSRSGEFL